MHLIPKRLLLRTTWLKVHLYLALSLGLFIALIGLTGSLSVYQQPLDTLLNPKLIVAQPQGQYQSLDTIMAAVRTAHPDRLGSWTLEMPSSEHGMVTAWFEKPRETYFELYAPLMVSVNPYTAEVVASRFWGRTFSTWILDCHSQLLLGSSGWNLVGGLGFFLIFSIVTGLMLWWPGISGLVTALKLRWRNGLMLLADDVHRLTGLLAALALLVLASSGILLSYPKLLQQFAGAEGMAHGETGRPIISTAIPNNHPTNLAAASFVAQGPFPKAELRRVTTPTGDSGIYRINLRQNSEINRRHPYTTVWVDRWSGQIKEVRNPNKFSSGETFASWVWPVHTGEALGGLGRFAWFLAGQSLFVLYVTGVCRWLIRNGLLKDRAVDFSGLAQRMLKLAQVVYDLAAVVFSQACRWAKTCTTPCRRNL